MKNMLMRILLVFTIISGLTMCKSEGGDKSDIAGFYRLNLPCEDCKFSIHSIHLEDNGSFKYTERQIGNDIVNRHSGTWDFEDGLIRITSETMEDDLLLEAENGFLRIKEPTRLNGKGKVEPLLAKAKFPVSEESSAQFLNGTDIYTEGYDARWFVAIGVNKFIQIKHPVSGEVFDLEYVKPEVDYEKKTNTWRLKVGDETAIFTLKRGLCETDYPAHMEFEIGEASREACSMYLDYKFDVHKVWELVEFMGKPMDGENLHRGLPVLELDVINRMGLGHTGCNVWNGGMKQMNSEIIFMPGPMSNAFCQDKGFEVEYIKNLGQSLEYAIIDGRLTLSLNGEPIYVYHEYDQ